jgi:hypothetical protein
MSDVNSKTPVLKSDNTRIENYFNIAHKRHREKGNEKLKPVDTLLLDRRCLLPFAARTVFYRAFETQNRKTAKII